MASQRAFDLSEELKAAVGDFVDYVARLTPEQWRRQASNVDRPVAPGPDEVRPVGVVAYHTAASMETIAGRMLTVASGGTPPPVAFSHEKNAEQAREHADATVRQVVELARDSGAAAVDMLRGLSGEQLARTIQFPVGEMSVEQMAQRVLIGHVRWHLESIRKACES